jgi:hypothetical protein
VAELREKLDAMEDNLKQKTDELTSALDNERIQESAAAAEKKELSDLKLNLESKLADAQSLNESLQSELDRLRASQANTERELHAQIEEARASGTGTANTGTANPELERENAELRAELEEQERVTEEVRREAQGFLTEMRGLSQRSTASYEREDELSNMVAKLELEVQDWRNRYARTKTQLRSLRATSMGLTIQPEAGKYVNDKGFLQENGMIKDVHVTKFQISIDELLRVARGPDQARVIEFMKSVVVNVRRITQDIDEAPKSSGEVAQLQSKLKIRVSATANNLITASRNFVGAKGLSPVSLLDAAASHLATAVVDLVRTVKIRPTPAGELEDDDDGSLAPNTTGLLAVQNGKKESTQGPFLGFQNGRTSGDSSMYSPVNSPRGSATIPRRSSARGSLANGLGIMNGNSNGTPAPMGFGFGIRTQDSDVEELKVSIHP